MGAFRTIFFLFVLGGFVASSRGEDASVIARKALLAAPPKDWTFSALLTTTKTSDKDQSGVQPGEKLLTVQFQHLSSGGRQITYRPDSKEDGKGLKISIPSATSVSGLKITDLNGQSVGDLQASFLGSAFTIEDVSLHFLSWKSQKFIGEETLKDRACWKISSSGKSGAYARVESWIDQQYQALLKAIAYDADGNVVKEFNVLSFRQFEDMWMLKVLELKAPSIGARSRLEILESTSGKD
jgi:hypothetical protein